MLTPHDGFDGAARAPIPEAHGEAALLLVESLIHGLVARSALSIGEAIDIVQIAIDAQVEISDARGDPDEVRPAVRYLSAIATSLKIDDRQKDGHVLDGDGDARVD